VNIGFHRNPRKDQEQAMNSIQRFGRDARGGTTVEYLILVGMIALFVYGGVQFFGTQLKAQMKSQGTSVSGVNNALVP
jgi:Flp pilus assembly pilin Flp